LPPFWAALTIGAFFCPSVCWQQLSSPRIQSRSPVWAGPAGTAKSISTNIADQLRKPLQQLKRLYATIPAVLALELQQPVPKTAPRNCCFASDIVRSASGAIPTDDSGQN